MGGTAPRPGGRLGSELLALLRPRDARLERQLSERVRPELARVARACAGMTPSEVERELAAVVLAAGGRPEPRAIAELAAEVVAGGNPFEG